MKCLSNPELVQQVFGLFKDYLLSQLDVKGKQIEAKQKTDKETIELKFKGNQKQFDLNADLDNIFDQIQTANFQATGDKISILVSEGKKLIHKRQKLTILRSLTDTKVVGRLSKNTNQMSWPLIQRMKRS